MGSDSSSAADRETSISPEEGHENNQVKDRRGKRSNDPIYQADPALAMDMTTGEGNRPSGLPVLQGSSNDFTTSSYQPNSNRRVGESRPVIQVESESPLGNTRLKKKVTANNIVPFARKQATVLA
jgi:hypothetical protein